MKPEVLTALENIRLAIEEIERYVRFRDGYQAYLAHRESQVMAERFIIVIGEGIARIKTHAPETPITEAPQIRGMRNRLVHDYDRIDQGAVFNVLVRHIPILKAEVETLLKQHG
ncbi:MAG: HepT-like ribonuclease domain-containing protein [Flavobacteriales bacterium]